MYLRNARLSDLPNKSLVLLDGHPTVYVWDREKRTVHEEHRPGTQQKIDPDTWVIVVQRGG